MSRQSRCFCFYIDCPFPLHPIPFLSCSAVQCWGGANSNNLRSIIRGSASEQCCECEVYFSRLRLLRR